jgi:hypothetical protein
VPEALALLRGEPDFNLAVLDIKLSGPDANSLGLAALLTAKGTPFIFLDRSEPTMCMPDSFPTLPLSKNLRPNDAFRRGASRTRNYLVILR